ncbi:MAG: phosphoribosylanthranilate isomerase [Actinomycetota bacterium]
MFVKICGVTNAEDALLAAGLGADAVGMIFAASSRRIATGEARDIVRRLPPEVIPVGVFRDESAKRVAEIANSIGLRAVQLSGHESPEDTRWLATRVPIVIKAFAATDRALANAEAYGAHRIMIDSATPGSGKVFDWAVLEEAPPNRPFILAGGLGPDNVVDAINTVKPWGVDLASGVEASPGVKDPAKLRQFMAAVRSVAPDEPEYDFDVSERPFNWEEDATLW